uniref:DUF1618 domain-containing protein n=1 Tax=Setaria viridis TaxID=4556 RepID=A0A4U6UXL3_SETVI|nr:hypothetical protein SEVIR_5G270800v2 [Setaria viridis]
MAVSFWVADPPDMPFFSVVCSKPADSVSKSSDFRISPHAVGAEGRFVLLRARFFSRYCKDELFMYTAGDTESPSLERVPLPHDDDDDDLNAVVGCLHGVREFGIVPRGLHYLVAALCDSRDSSLDYQRHVYSSETTPSKNSAKHPNFKTSWSCQLHGAVVQMEMEFWSTSFAAPETSLLNLLVKLVGNYPPMPLVTKNVSFYSPEPHSPPEPRPSPPPWVKTIKPEKVITLGEGVLGWVDFSHSLLVCNLFQEQLPRASPRLFWDLTCVDGKLKFIEMEHGTEVPEKPSDPCDDDVLYDSELIRLLDSEDMDDKSESRHAWRDVTWSRTVSSNYWCKECVVDVAGIVVNESANYLLLPGLRGETVGKFKFRDLYSVFPILSIDNGDILYLKSSVEPSDQNGWVVTVDLGNKKVKALRAYPFENHDPTKQAFRTSTLSCHLVITPGIKVSTYRKITQVGKSANSSNSASKLKCTRDETQSSMQNDQSRMKQQRQVCVYVNSSHILVVLPDIGYLFLIGLMFVRLLAEKITLPLNKAPSIIQNDHISQVDPVQKILAPTPVLHGYVSYQPLWHQPPPWRQEQPCSEFEPHKASQPCFNKHNGASYHGYLQQLPAPNSVAYGTHSVYGNNQQQLQSLPPIYNLPASGSWQQPPPMQHQLKSSGVWTS